MRSAKRAYRNINRSNRKEIEEELKIEVIEKTIESL
jgi:hypothetical protein